MSFYFPTEKECGHRMIFGNVAIQTMAGEHLQFSLATVPPRGVVHAHSHPNEQLGLILSGEGLFTIGGEKKHVKPGDLYRIPGGVEHELHALDSEIKALDVFYPVREEYR